jgi:hypothetical protein
MEAAPAICLTVLRDRAAGTSDPLALVLPLGYDFP